MAMVDRKLKAGDVVMWTSATGESVRGIWLDLLDEDTALVRVGERAVQVAVSACCKVTEWTGN